MQQHHFDSPGRVLLNKVPQVTLAFWVIKIMATTVGETAADFLITDMKLGLSMTSVAMGVLLALALAVQLRARRYVPWMYWLAVVLVSIVGTLITDNLTDHAGVPLELTTGIFSAMLAIVFSVWYASERTLSITEVTTRRRELFYWAAVLLTFALGTAAGDLVAERLQLGFIVSGLLFGTGIAAAAVAHYVFKASAVLTFWIAYILTRPFGASLGDALTQPHEAGGLGLGTESTTMAFLVVIVVLIALETMKFKRQGEPAAP